MKEVMTESKFFEMLDDMRMEYAHDHDIFEIVEMLEKKMMRRLSEVEVEWVESCFYYEEE